MDAAHTARSTAQQIARYTVLGIALLLALTALYILAVPVDANDFESTTGASWDSFSDANPEVADYLAREARLLATGFLGFSLMSAVIAWRWPHGAGVPAVRVLWLLPLTMWAAAIVFFTGDGGALGAIYLVAGLIAAGALLVVMRRTSMSDATRVPR
jgi:hypothetical protein